jgi:hypothetical protein
VNGSGWEQGPQQGSPQQGGPQQWQPQPPRKKRWPYVLVALGCVFVLVLGGVIGTAAYLFRPGGPLNQTPTAAPTTEDPTTKPPETTEPFTILSPYEYSEMSPDEITEVMRTSPLTTGNMPTSGDCALPGITSDSSNEELEAFLNAGAGCYSGVWSTFNSDRALPWSTPTVVVFDWPDVPESSACEADTFTEGLPRTCNLDNVIYWPSDGGTIATLAADEEYAGALMWDLSVAFSLSEAWQSSIQVYYRDLDDGLEGDQDARDEATLRFSLQFTCLAAAGTMSLPETSRPPSSLQEKMQDTEVLKDSYVSPPDPEIRSLWVSRGLQGTEDMSVCNTWDAPAEEIVK